MDFVDTNVLLYAISKSPIEQGKRDQALAVLEKPDIALSAQVLGEFYTQATRPSRQGALTHQEAVEFIDNLQRFHIEHMTFEVVRTALIFRESFGVSYWDASILATARIAGCTTVYSEDLSHTQDYDGIRVQNPFAPSEATDIPDSER